MRKVLTLIAVVLITGCASTEIDQLKDGIKEAAKICLDRAGIHKVDIILECKDGYRQELDL